MTNHSEGNSNEAVAETSVHDRKELSADFRFSEIVESTVQGVVEVITQSMVALFFICFHPRSFAKRMEDTKSLSHPMTFLALATLVSAQCLPSAITKPNFKGPSLVGTLTETLSSFSIESLVTRTFPTILIVVAIAQLFRLWRFTECDRIRITKAAYFAVGAAFIELFAISILLRLWLLRVADRIDHDQVISKSEPRVISNIYGCLILAIILHAAVVVFGALPLKWRRSIDRYCVSSSVSTAMLFSGWIGDSLRIVMTDIQSREIRWFGEKASVEESIYGMQFHWDSASSTGKYSFVLRSPGNGSAEIFRDDVGLRLFRKIGSERIEFDIPKESVNVLDWSSSDNRLFTIDQETRWIEIGFTLAEPAEFTSLLKSSDPKVPGTIECLAEFATGPIRNTEGRVDQEKLPIQVEFPLDQCQVE